MKILRCMTPAILLIAVTARADDFYAKSGNGNWNASTSWGKTSGTSTRTYPRYPYDTAFFTNLYNTGASDPLYRIDVPASGTGMGCAKLVFYARPDEYSKIDIHSRVSSATLTFQSTNGPAIIQVVRGSSLNLGYRYTASYRLTLQLKSDLLVTNSESSTHNTAITVGAVSSSYAQTIISDDGAPHDIIVNAGSARLMNLYLASAISTFRGQLRVVGEKSTVTACGNGSFGHADNTILLSQGGNLTLRNNDTFQLLRRVTGNGTVRTTQLSNPYARRQLMVGAGGVLAPGQSGVGTLAVMASTNILSSAAVTEIQLAAADSHDRIDFTGDLQLGGELAVETLDGHVPERGQRWPVLTATGQISGSFDTVPSGYEVAIEGSSVMLRRTSGATVLLVR